MKIKEKFMKKLGLVVMALVSVLSLVGVPSFAASPSKVSEQKDVPCAKWGESKFGEAKFCDSKKAIHAEPKSQNMASKQQPNSNRVLMEDGSGCIKTENGECMLLEDGQSKAPEAMPHQ
jgi:hypothetical protein